MQSTWLVAKLEFQINCWFAITKTVTSSPLAENGDVGASWQQLQFGLDTTFTLKTFLNRSLSSETDDDVKLEAWKWQTTG